ncbi:hypothetical protein GRI89_07765 [Altererythrobacter salegens]|uniref:Protein TonB n=1 Tax=Croceibacterium salegens TaxID=1737568 RepID=A0A6I4SX69_9SPHN|nr:hypothetical protein [Croceibacterium salegens]MXO59436.1 hypothetical protein [Croceibacterium salegens]
MGGGVLPDRIASILQTDRGRRIAGVTVTLALEAVLLLALLTLGSGITKKTVPFADIVSFDARDYSQPSPDPEPKPRPATQPRIEPQRIVPPAPQPSPPPAAVIPVAPTPAPIVQPQQPVSPRPITAPPPGAKVYGPAAPSRQADSQRVGTAPNGQPLYAASWYRRPTDKELLGYLSTATAGYAVISCRTVPDFRVEDCVLETESPKGSGMGRAVLSAAWQFRVRPPMIGGQYQVGDWVRIMISYDIRENRFKY